MIVSPQRRMPRRIALGVVLVVLSCVLAATAATASASSATPTTTAVPSELTASAEMSYAPARTAALSPTARTASMTAPTRRRTAPKPRVRTAVRTATRTDTYTYSAGIRRVSKTAARTTAVQAKATATKKPSSGELAQARAILAGYIAKYPICKGATVYFGKTAGGSEGCVYLGSGTIVINPNHTSSLSYIIGHEIQHLREYRAGH